MKEQLNQWLTQHAQIAGIQACGLRHPDQTTFTEVREFEFTQEALENAWRCVADLFQVARHHGCAAGYLRWSFDQSNLYCLTRPDGTCLMAFTSPKPTEMDAPGLQAMFEAFQELQLAPEQEPPTAAPSDSPESAHGDARPTPEASAAAPSDSQSGSSSVAGSDGVPAGLVEPAATDQDEQARQPGQDRGK